VDTGIYRSGMAMSGQIILGGNGDPPSQVTTHCNTLQHTATHCNTLRHTLGGNSDRPLQAQIVKSRPAAKFEMYNNDYRAGFRQTPKTYNGGLKGKL